MSILAKRPIWLRTVVAGTPMKFEPALDHDAGATPAEIESHAQINAQRGRGLPIASREQLVYLGLRRGRTLMLSSAP